MKQPMTLPGSGPVSERLYALTKRLIESGAYPAFSYLPSARETAEMFGINPNTVVKAYRRLESEGFLDCLDRKGYRVKETNPGEERRLQLDRLLLPIAEAGYDPDEVDGAYRKLMKGDGHDH